MKFNQGDFSNVAARRGVRGEVFTSLDDDRLEVAWGHLEARFAQTGFERFNYVKPVYLSFLPGTKDKPLIIVLYDESSGEPICIVPLVFTQRVGVKVLELLDYYVIDFAAIPLNQEKLSDIDCLRAAADTLRNCLPDCDFVRCNNLVADSTAFHLLRQALGVTKHHVRDTTHNVPLADGGYEAYVSSNRMYKKMVQKLRRLERDFGIVIEPTTDPAEIDKVMDAMFEQRKARFEKLGLFDGVADPRRQQIFRRVAHTLCPDEGALLLSARIDGECVATSFGACCEDGFFTSQLSSFTDGPWSKHSPGLVTVALEIDWAHARKCRTYNLGAGEADYKTRFGLVDQHRVSLHVARSSSGWLYHGAHRLKRLAFQCVKQIHGNPRALAKKVRGALKPLRLPWS